MQTYDLTRQPFPSQIPSATPIYDALYSEYRRAFRTLPGDRSGEEDFGFKGFGGGRHGGRSGHSGHTGFGSGVGSGLGSGGGQTSGWQSGVRQHTGAHHHVPAALPPAPRRGL
ncbi:hypothetical protein [Streptomyces sp. NPDC059909]|uniref:hypothetical protein n=1 Tax=Streptomyces sp. NPDC059909 TaxID=3346998 RepID=UPI003669F57F